MNLKGCDVGMGLDPVMTKDFEGMGGGGTI